MLGILAASLFCGDGMITPAISVFSAVEGVKVAAPSLGSLVLPIAWAAAVRDPAVRPAGSSSRSSRRA
jgi:KUP system potassium uptake protein